MSTGAFVDGATTESLLVGFVVAGFVVAGFVVAGFVVAVGFVVAGFVVAVVGFVVAGFVVAVGFVAPIGSEDGVAGREVTAPGSVFAGLGTDVRDVSGATSFLIVDDVAAGLLLFLLSFFLSVLEVVTEPLPEPFPDPFGLEAKTGAERHKTPTPQMSPRIWGLRRME